MILIESELGKVELRPGEYKPVSDIHTPDPYYWVDFDVAEAIAAITENRNLQWCFSMEKKILYLVHHESVSVAAVCEVVSVKFDGPGRPVDYLAPTDYLAVLTP
jgi:hypothetical protein